MVLKATVLVSLVMAAAGCWNGGNTHVNFGDVSVGQQLIDLKSALDEGAISADEFAQTKATLLALNSLCENTEAETDDEADSGFDWF